MRWECLPGLTFRYLIVDHVLIRNNSSKSGQQTNKHSRILIDSISPLTPHRPPPSHSDGQETRQDINDTFVSRWLTEITWRPTIGRQTNLIHMLFLLKILLDMPICNWCGWWWWWCCVVVIIIIIMLNKIDFALFLQLHGSLLLGRDDHANMTWLIIM